VAALPRPRYGPATVTRGDPAHPGLAVPSAQLVARVYHPQCPTVVGRIVVPVASKDFGVQWRAICRLFLGWHEYSA
jgi:hypothetical protein